MYVCDLRICKLILIISSFWILCEAVWLKSIPPNLLLPWTFKLSCKQMSTLPAFVAFYPPLLLSTFYPSVHKLPCMFLTPARRLRNNRRNKAEVA